MTLHEAIIKLLQEQARSMTAQEIADHFNQNHWYQKGDNSLIAAGQIRRRAAKYAHLFSLNGSKVSLLAAGSIPVVNRASRRMPVEVKKAEGLRTTKDEHYVIELCDEVLGCMSSRQHRFPFLVGDVNAKGKATRLPVDAYYEELKLVIEYREVQHSEEVAFFDKKDKLTVSGVHRGEQRRIYDDRRRKILPLHGIRLIELAYSDFQYDSKRRIVRNTEGDILIIKEKLRPVL